MNTLSQPAPCPPPWWQPSSPCLDEVTQFKRMMQEMIEQAVDEKIERLIQQGALPPGVVDGSDARPGQVGEWMRNQVDGTFAATAQTQIVSAIILPAGDWDVEASCLFGPPGFLTGICLISDATMVLNPVPTGLSDDMYSIFAASQIGPTQFTGIAELVLLTPRVRASVTVPTLLPVEIETQRETDPNNTSGAFRLITTARRVR